MILASIIVCEQLNKENTKYKNTANLYLKKFGFR